MPFEAGLAVGSVHGTDIEHQWFVFEKVPYRLQKSLSDLNGYDPLIHGGTVRGLLGALTEAFVRDGVTLAHLLAIYRRLQKVAGMLRQGNGKANLFNGAAFRTLVLSAEEIAKDVLGVS